MKTDEFKKILKPLIKQTIKEVILEEGILSNIVAEVAKGLQGNLVVETKAAEATQKQISHEEQRQERIRRLNEASKFGDAFDGTQELREQSQGPMSGVRPGDQGVDISAIQKIANGKWKRLI